MTTYIHGEMSSPCLMLREKENKKKSKQEAKESRSMDQFAGRTQEYSTASLSTQLEECPDMEKE